MGVGAKTLGKLFEPDFEFWSSACATHRSFQAKLECHLFKDGPVFVFAIIDGMDEFVHQCIEYGKAIAEVAP